MGARSRGSPPSTKPQGECIINWTTAQREERANTEPKAEGRGEFERDRDRLLYSSGFHRLAGITQIVRSGEADYFHTRQQHTLKVAQLGRRLAQRRLADQATVANRRGVDPEVVEAACLAHDMGHPPFGHIGEKVLDELVRAAEPGSDGYEGNAQSFRIITKLGVRSADWDGLDLTRATMAAVLKYPWFHDATDPRKKKKWSSYRSERAEFEFAREHHPGEEQTAEAALMDWADDIAYSVHDLEDFHRAGAIPWHLIFEDDERRRLVEKAHGSWFEPPADAVKRLTRALGNLKGLFEGFDVIVREPYTGSREHRQALRTLTSTLIGRYVEATRLSEVEDGHPLAIPPNMRDEVTMLKQITRDYVISTPSLAAQQLGQRKVLEELFGAIHGGSASGPPKFLPVRMEYLWNLSGNSRARFAADCVASLSEGQATALYGRLTGTAAGSVLDPIVR